MKKRIIAMLLFAAVLFVILSSALFVVHEAGHDCMGAGCKICTQMESCTQFLKNIAIAIIAAAVATRWVAIFQIDASRFALSQVQGSLVALKVKLSN